MTQTATKTTTDVARAANKAGKTIIESVVEASDHVLPTVVETAEVAVALDVPSKVVVNQKLVVVVTALAAAGIGVAGTITFQKLKAKRDAKKAEKQMQEELELAEKATKP